MNAFADRVRLRMRALDDCRHFLFRDLRPYDEVNSAKYNCIPRERYSDFFKTLCIPKPLFPELSQSQWSVKNIGKIRITKGRREKNRQKETEKKNRQQQNRA